MAKFKELNFILGLKPEEFMRGAQRADAEHGKTKKKVEQPMRLRANVQNLLSSFATVGLAMNGLRQTFNLVLGPAKELTRLADVQERADTRLAAALRTRNVFTKENLALLKQQASAIQAVTVVGDEQAQSLQTLALNMGVVFDKVDEVTRGAIGLSESFKDAGLSQETAIKGISLAYQGNFEQLQRYIPALRTTEDETEKMTILQKAMADGFKQSEEFARSDAGQKQQFANIIGDLKEKGGEMINDFLVPLVQVATPVVTFLNDMDQGTRNATVATIAFIGVVGKGRTTILALRGAVLALNASLGPAGWLILGIGAAATAFGVFQLSADDATESLANFRAEAAAMERQELEKKLADIRTEFAKLFQEREKMRQSAGSEILFGPGGIEAISADIDLLIEKEKILKERLGELDREKADSAKRTHEEEQENLDELRQYQFETNRISLEDYVQYLERRREELRKSLGEESVEYLKFIDRLRELQLQQFQLDMTGKEQAVAREIETADLIRETQEQLAADQDAIRQQQEENEAAFQQRKVELARQGAQMTLTLGAQLMSAFQGQSKTLFEAGKAASIAESTIQAYQAIARAYKDYPWPFNLAVAAIQGTLAFAQVAKMKKEKYEPKGFAEGTERPLQHGDLMSASFVPAGEHGLVAVQVGERIMNRRASQMFGPMLDEMNRVSKSRRSTAIPAFQEGGEVTQTAGLVVMDPGRLGEVVEDAIITGFRNSRLRITGELTGDGNELKSVIDKINELTSQL